MKRRNLLKFLPLPFLPLTWGRATESEIEKQSIPLVSTKPQSAPQNNCYAVQSGLPKIGKTDTWIVGEVIDRSLIDSGEPVSWAFVGVFDSEEAAIRACTNEYQFVGPTVINKVHDDVGNHRCWAGCWYPMCEENPRLALYNLYVAPLDWIRKTHGGFPAFFDGYPKNSGKGLLHEMEYFELIEIDHHKLAILALGQDILGEYERRLAKIDQG
jgi:hypothetical protein